MNPDWLIVIATGIAAVAAIASAFAAAYSSRVAARSHDLQRWSIHGAHVYVHGVQWSDDGYQFDLAIANDGPGIAFGVTGDVAPSRENFSGVRPQVREEPIEPPDLPPGGSTSLAGDFRQHSERSMGVWLRWNERADDGAQRPRSRWMKVERHVPPAGSAPEH